jgi:hypothetical protein
LPITRPRKYDESAGLALVSTQQQLGYGNNAIRKIQQILLALRMGQHFGFGMLSMNASIHSPL